MKQGSAQFQDINLKLMSNFLRKPKDMSVGIFDPGVLSTQSLSFCLAKGLWGEWHVFYARVGKCHLCHPAASTWPTLQSNTLLDWVGYD